MNVPEDANQNDFRDRVLLAIFVGLVIVALLQAQKNNQITPPIPGGPRAPIVPQLPDIAGELRSLKSRCESRARAAISILRRQQDGFAKEDLGRMLYDEAKAEADGCITFLNTAISRRFIAEDVGDLSARWAATKQKSDAFVAWSYTLEGPVFGADGPFDTVSQMLKEWMERVNEQNEQAITRLINQLEQCRLRPWDEVTTGP